MDAYSPIRGKCVWWREVPHAEDSWDPNVKPPDKRWECSCFVEGGGWTFTLAEMPADCPNSRRCRYYVKGF